jgi:hypothetical protein
VVDWIQDFGGRLIRQAQGDSSLRRAPPSFNVFRIPFVDYARGDGMSIGPGSGRPWGDPVLLDQSARWALNYRGLWGLYARDPIAGENAPAGPVFNRDGNMRRSWYDPLGWAGLDKVPPPDEVLSRVERQEARIAARRSELEATIAAKASELTGLDVEAEAMRGHPHLERAYAEHQERIAALSRELRELRAELAGDLALKEALELAVVALILLARQYLVFGLVAMLSVLIFVEASFRRQVARLVDSVTIALAIVTVLVLTVDFFWQIVVILVLLAGAYIIWENLRELRG